MRFEVLAVVARDALVLAEDVGLKLDRACLAHAGHRNACRAGPEVQVAVARVDLHVGMLVLAAVRVDMRVPRPFSHHTGRAGL
ncbi:hypothetical protein GCM10009107_16590 [Ideonella azotifigens]|uniref:Secreted protein n=1 Tax=Ideonella azotifigens TaxID=513160 RepID=A0ABP3V6M8_9BURK